MEPKSNCYRCGRICLAVLRNGGVARVDEIGERTGYSSRLIAVHIQHLIDSGQLRAAGEGSWRLVGTVGSEKFAQ